MAMTTIRNVLIAGGISVLAVTGIALAAGTGPEDGYKMKHPDWKFAGATGYLDQEAMQRGYQVYREVCRACHNLDHLAFRHLGDKGGPFYDPNYPNPSDNPLVKNIAADYIVEDIDNETGDVIERPGIPADYFPPVYPNEVAARATNGGALPPDLSVITKARTDGVDYLYNLMLGYDHPMPADKELSAGTYYNPVMPGGAIAMPPQLQPLEGVFEYQSELEGQNPPEATVEQMTKDLTTFLVWAADPKMQARKNVGMMSLIYLLILAVLLWLSYKRIWRPLKEQGKDRGDLA